MLQRSPTYTSPCPTRGPDEQRGQELQLAPAHRAQEAVDGVVADRAPVPQPRHDRPAEVEADEDARQARSRPRPARSSRSGGAPASRRCTSSRATPGCTPRSGPGRRRRSAAGPSQPRRPPPRAQSRDRESAASSRAGSRSGPRPSRGSRPCRRAGWRSPGARRGPCTWCRTSRRTRPPLRCSAGRRAGRSPRARRHGRRRRSGRGGSTTAASSRSRSTRPGSGPSCGRSAS